MTTKSKTSAAEVEELDPAIKFLRVVDMLGDTRSLVEAIFMAASDLDEAEQRAPIKHVANIVSNQIRDAIDLLNEARGAE